MIRRQGKYPAWGAPPGADEDFILREAPTVLTIFGGVLILGGIYISARVERQGG
jgi:hypothetical protein